MKKAYIKWQTSILMLLSSMATGYAGAHDVTVNITGSIVDNPCIVSTDSVNKTVQMGHVSTKQFTQVNDTSSPVPFSINLEKCGSAVTGVSLTLEGTPDTDNGQLLALDSPSGSASGLAIGILDDTHTLIPIGKASKLYAIDGAGGQTVASLPFYAQYTSTQSQVTAGDANASVTFTLSYP